MNTKKEQEFIKAYGDYSDALFRYCFFKINDREVAVDMVSEIFTKTWDYIREEHDIENIRSLLYRIGHNMVIDWYRKKKSISLDSLTEDGFDPVDESVNIMVNTELSHALTMLSLLEHSDKDLILWRCVEDLSISEIAGMLSQKENVVSVRLHRALARLKILLNRS